MTEQEALQYIAERDYIIEINDLETMRKWVREFIEVAKEALKMDTVNKLIDKRPSLYRRLSKK